MVNTLFIGKTITLCFAMRRNAQTLLKYGSQNRPLDCGHFWRIQRFRKSVKRVSDKTAHQTHETDKWFNFSIIYLITIGC